MFIVKKKKSYSERRHTKTLKTLSELKSEMGKSGGRNPERETESGLLRRHLEKAMQKTFQKRKDNIYYEETSAKMSFEEMWKF
jgi:hypothetical protein